MSKTYTLMLGKNPIATVNEQTLEIDTKRAMEYYYRRGNKYFFRDAISRVVFSGTIDFELKRNEIYYMDWGW